MERFGRRSAALVSIVATAVLLGWYGHVEILTTWLPGSVSMKPNTAVALLVLSLLVARRRNGWPSAIAAALVAALGAGTLVEHVAGVSLRIDLLMPGIDVGEDSGRMAPASATAILLLGLSLLAGAVHHGRLLRAGAIGAFWIGYVALLGAAYSISSLFDEGVFSTVAVSTALCVVVLSVCLLLTDPTAGLVALLSDRGSAGRLLRPMIPVLLVVPAVLGAARLRAQQAGWFDTSFGVALLVTSMTVLLFAMSWRAAVGLRALDVQRDAALFELERLNVQLEGTVAARTFELQDAVTSLAALIRLAPVGIVRLGPGGGLESSNEQWRILSGLDEARSNGTGWRDAVHRDDKARVGKEWSGSEAAGRPLETTFRLVTPAGKINWVQLRTAPLVEDGGLVAHLATVTDVTELRAARAEAERANRAKDEFLSRMSHELRTPLNAVLGFGQLIERQARDPGLQEGAGQILRAGHHLLSLIDEILDLSRIATHDLRLELEPVDLVSVVTESLELVSGTAQSLEVTIRTSVHDAVVGVHADRQRLKQSVINLLSNAVKYNRARGVVDVDVVEGADVVRLSVRDDGIGMSADDLARLFVPFERLGAERLGVQGTGLGLSLTRGLVEAMGGRIEVTSEPGRGSTFTLVLARSPVPAPRVPIVERRASPRPSGTLRRVLYIEDNPTNVLLVERALAGRPRTTVRTAVLGGLGLDLAREEPYDLVLLDLHLPDISGEEVLLRLRADPVTASLPVVVLSADATVGQRSRLLALGATDYVVKPFDLDRLLGVVERYGVERPAAERPVVERPVVERQAVERPVVEGPAAERPAGPEVLAGSPVFDPTLLRSLCPAPGEGMPDEVAALVETCLSETGTQLDQLADAMVTGSSPAVADLAHRLRGGSAGWGAMRLADLVAGVEDAARSGRTGHELMADLRCAFEATCAAVLAEFAVPTTARSSQSRGV